MDVVLFLVLCVILFLFLIPIIGKKQIFKDMGQVLFSALSFAVIIVWLEAFLLVLFNKYSLLRLDILLIITAIFVIIMSRKGGRWQVPSGFIRHDKFNIIILLFFVLISYLYLAYPTYYIIGGRDQGVYSSLGVYISRTGGLHIHDDFLTDNYDVVGDVLRLGYPGYYSGYECSLSSQPGRLIPQFMHLFPTVLAIGYDIGGMPVMFRMNGAIGIISLLAIYFFCTQLLDKKVAFLATVALAFNPSQIWNARITQTEVLSQFLLFFALFLLVFAYKKDRRSFTWLSGIILGLNCLNRIDCQVFGIGVFVFVIYMAIISRERLRFAFEFGLSYALAALLSLTYAYFYSYPYFDDLWHRASLKPLVMINVLLFVIAALVVIIAYMLKKQGKGDKTKIRNSYKKFLYIKRHHIAAILAVLLVGLFLYAYFVRPDTLPASTDINSEEHFTANAMVEFGWYVPEAITLMAIVGLILLIKETNINAYVVFIVIAMANIVGYIYKPSITPDHIWASRRWIAVSIPSVIIFAMAGMERISRSSASHRRVLLWVFVSFMLVFFFHQSSLFIKTPMLRDYKGQFDDLAEHIPEDEVFITNSGQLATPLRIVYDKPVYEVRGDYNQDALYDMVKHFGKVYTIGWLPENMEDRLDIQKVYHLEFNGKYLQKVRGAYPNQVIDRKYNGDLYILTAK